MVDGVRAGMCAGTHGRLTRIGRKIAGDNHPFSVALFEVKRFARSNLNGTNGARLQFEQMGVMEILIRLLQKIQKISRNKHHIASNQTAREDFRRIVGGASAELDAGQRVSFGKKRECRRRCLEPEWFKIQRGRVLNKVR